MREIHRGDVYWVDLKLEIGSHIQGGTRPCVVVSNDAGNAVSPVVTVVPLSTKLDDHPYHPRVYTRKEGQALCEQITTVNTSDLGDFVCKLDPMYMDAIETCLLGQLNLPVSVETRTVDVSSFNELKAELVRVHQRLGFMESFIWKCFSGNGQAV